MIDKKNSLHAAMKYLSLALAANLLLLMGCASTQVVEVTRNDHEAIASINSMAVNERATVQLLTSEVSVEAREALVISYDTVRYVLRHSDVTVNTPLARIRELGFAKSGVGRGALYGGLAGAAGLTLAMLSSNDGFFTDEQIVTTGILVGGPLGALIGGLIGGASGSKRVVYRFRPDTPRQMSVVIGVRPSAAINRGGR